MSSIANNDLSGLDSLTIKGGTTLEFRDRNNDLLFNDKVNADSGFHMNSHILMNNYDIAGGRNIGTNNHINAHHDITTNNILKRQLLEITQTSIFTGEISTKH